MDAGTTSEHPVQADALGRVGAAGSGGGGRVACCCSSGRPHCRGHPGRLGMLAARGGRQAIRSGRVSIGSCGQGQGQGIQTVTDSVAQASRSSRAMAFASRQE